MSLGGFHRSHQARYLHDYLQTHNENWGIYSIGLLDNDVELIQHLQSQDNLYTLVERSGSEDVVKVIGSIKSTVHAPSKPEFTIEKLSSDDIKIISLTITEKGYCYDSKKNLDVEHPMIKADLSPGAIPVSAIGYLFAACNERMENNGEPFTLLSCDNLPGNGEVSKRILLQFAEAKDAQVAKWIQQNVSFPNSMVDRITPAPNEDTVKFVKNQFGIEDPAALISESFSQWIIEDDFINGRPALEEVGVQFVGDVEPYEKLKVRLLNGSHSALSYLSYLIGHRNVDLAMADPLVADFVRLYMDEDVTQSIPQVSGIDVEQYKDILIERFSNPAISDQIQRLAMDGSEKIVNAIAPVIEYQIENGGSLKYIAFAIAAWYRYLIGVDESGNTIEIVDPMAKDLSLLANANPQDPKEFLSIAQIFGEKASQNNEFVNQVREKLALINEMGTKNALTKLLQQ